jgi:porphobilinogen synthase
VKNFLLFPIPSQKQSHNFSFESGQKLIQKIKEEFSNDLSLWVDTCLCSTTANGHCCLFHKDGKINLTSTVQTLSEEALAFAQAGADGISPSDMMDGRVLAIRNRLDDAGFPLVPIMSYSTKFASHFYGPFREIADSSPQHGDRRQYQLDVRNRSEAIEASLRCSKEGADLLMVKPGLTAIDLISDIATQTGLPVGAYQVSGEYASLALLAKNGLGDFKQLFAETLHVFRRAGARYIITYGARHARSVGF